MAIEYGCTFYKLIDDAFVSNLLALQRHQSEGGEITGNQLATHFRVSNLPQLDSIQPMSIFSLNGLKNIFLALTQPGDSHVIAPYGHSYLIADRPAEGRSMGELHQISI